MDSELPHCLWTPLFKAAALGEIDCIHLLLEFGADPYYEKSDGCIPIDLAIRNGHKEARELLQLSMDEIRANKRFDGCFITTIASH